MVTVSFFIVWHVIGDENQISILKLGVNSAVLKEKGLKFNVFSYLFVLLWGCNKCDKTLTFSQ